MDKREAIEGYDLYHKTKKNEQRSEWEGESHMEPHNPGRNFKMTNVPNAPPPLSGVVNNTPTTCCLWRRCSQ